MTWMFVQPGWWAMRAEMCPSPFSMMEFKGESHHQFIKFCIFCYFFKFVLFNDRSDNTKIHTATQNASNIFFLSKNKCMNRSIYFQRSSRHRWKLRPAREHRHQRSRLGPNTTEQRGQQTRHAVRGRSGCCRRQSALRSGGRIQSQDWRSPNVGRSRVRQCWSCFSLTQSGRLVFFSNYLKSEFHRKKTYFSLLLSSFL